MKRKRIFVEIMAVLLMAQLGTITAASVAVSVVTFAVGFVIAMKLGD